MIFYQILSTFSLRKCIEISVENLYVYIGAERVIAICFLMPKATFVQLKSLQYFLTDFNTIIKLSIINLLLVRSQMPICAPVLFHIFCHGSSCNRSCSKHNLSFLLFENDETGCDLHGNQMSKAFCFLFNCWDSISQSVEP